MSDRKTKKQKIRSQQRIFLEQEQLKKLKQEVLELKEQIQHLETQNKNNKVKRKLLIFKSCCNFSIPYVLTAGLCVGTFYICDGGLPFVKDEVIKHKKYTFECDLNGTINMKENYHFMTALHDSVLYKSELPKNELTIYSPYVKSSEGEYECNVKSFIIDSIDMPQLFDAVIDKDMNFILNNLTSYEENVIVRNELLGDYNNYQVEANLYMCDKYDMMVEMEDNSKNILVSFFESFITVVLGTLFAAIRPFKLKKRIVSIKEEYKIENVQPLLEQLETAEQKVLNKRW